MVSRWDCMRHLASALAAGLAVATVVCGCGQASSATSSGVAVGQGRQVRQIHVSINGQESTEWYVKNGPWSATYGKDARLVYDGSEYVTQASPQFRVVKGDPGYVHASAVPFVEAAPGVSLMATYDAGYLQPNKDVKVQKSSDGTVTVDFTYQYDYSTPVEHVHVVADPPISWADAQAKGAFALPQGTPNETIDADEPGAASTIGMTAYWLGPEFNGHTARVSVQTLKTIDDEDDIAADHEYRTVYRTASVPSAGQSHGFASYPGAFGDESQDIYVTNYLNNSRAAENLKRDDPSRTITPVTLADGEHARLISTQINGEPIDNHFDVQTPKTLIEISGSIGSLQVADAVRIADQLHPVG